MGLRSRTLLLFGAACLMLVAIVCHQRLTFAQMPDWLPHWQQPMASMNMTNKLGDHDFWCLDRMCDDQGGFQGRQTGWLYANRIDAVLGKHMVTDR